MSKVSYKRFFIQGENPLLIKINKDFVKYCLENDIDHIWLATKINQNIKQENYSEKEEKNQNEIIIIAEKAKDGFIITLTSYKTTKKNDKPTDEDLHRLRMNSVGEMAAGIIHDITNPLSHITTNLDLLKMTIYSETTLNSDLQLELVKKISAIEKGAGRVLDIVSAMKLISRKDQLKFEESDIEQVSLYSITLCKKFLDKNKIKISLENHLKTNKILMKDILISQVLVNLIKNSADAISNLPFTQKWIEVELRENENFTIVSIQDGGNGIPDEIKNKIFDPFFTTKEKGSGTGLGLSIVKQIMESHNGSISINTETSNTCFEIKISKKLKN